MIYYEKELRYMAKGNDYYLKKTLDDTVEGEFTNRLFQLDDRQLYKPKK